VHVDLDNLVSTCVLGLFGTASDFEKPVQFSSYAKNLIKGAILDGLRQPDWASRDMRRRLKQVQIATHELAATLQRAPMEADLAEKLEVDVGGPRTLMVDLHNVGLVSASSRANEGELPAPDFPDKAEGQPDRICARAELRSTVGEAMKKPPERCYRILRPYYGNEMTMKEIGCILRISESRACQSRKRCSGNSYWPRSHWHFL
jgi:RNA polymerase sigma factor for flagellar operon FliA